MTFFEEATLRLSQQLGLRLDKDIAEVLGITKRAWAGRKKSDKFPETELYALAAKRPELKLDVDYVLTGITREAHARLAANRAAGERRSDGGGDYREGWLESDAAMAPIQRALEVDREGFIALAQAWGALPPDDKSLLLAVATALGKNQKGA